MTEQREEYICENCIKVLTSEPKLDEVAFCREEKKAEAKNSAEDKKNEQNNYGFISYLKIVQKIRKTSKTITISFRTCK